MKHNIIREGIFCGLLTAFSGCSVHAQEPDESWRVSPMPAPANVLIEEFTGLHCSYCPQAHAISNNLTYVAGDRIHVMAVHTGSLAAPSADEPDLRTRYGEAMYAWQGVGSMPSGNINRRVYPECNGNSYSLSRSDWAAVAKRLLSDETPAPLNLYAEAHLDTSESIIHVLIEAYSAVSAEQPLRLNVALTENFVPGTQAGSNLRPYLHRHVLRDLITGLEGDTLKVDETVQGAYLRRTYTYKLLSTFNGIAPNPANLACLVYVTSPDHAVLNSIEVPVKSPVKAPIDYVQINLYGLDKVYAGPIYEVYVLNPSDDTIRSLEFTLDLDGDTRACTLNSLALPPKTESTVRLEADFDVDKFQKTNVYTLRLLKANGLEVKSNMVKNSFHEPLTLPSDSFKVLFSSDEYGGENTVSLTDSRGEALYQAGPFTDGECRSYMSSRIEARNGEVYALHVTDAFRDGVQESQTSGYALKVLTAGDSVLYEASVGVYGHAVSFRLPNQDTVVAVEKVLRTDNGFRVNLCPNPTNGQTVLQIEDLDPATEVCISIYNLQGQFREAVSHTPQTSTLTVPLRVNDYPQGLYLVRITQSGRQQVIKMVVQK